MVAISAPNAASAYYLAAASAQAAGVTPVSTASAPVVEQAATSLTLSDEARAALATADFATVLADTRAKLDAHRLHLARCS